MCGQRINTITDNHGVKIDEQVHHLFYLYLCLQFQKAGAGGKSIRTRRAGAGRMPKSKTAGMVLVGPPPSNSAASTRTLHV